MASLAELEAEYNRLGQLQRELNQRVRNAQTDEEAREAQAERQIVRDQIAALDPALTRARAQAATSFSLIPDPQTGGYQLRTGDGWFIASGQTAEAAKQAGLAQGANPAAINALQDPAPRTRPTVQGTYRIGIQPGTGLWLVDFQAPDGRTYGMGRAALPQDAINLAQQRRQTQNDPVTGEGFYGTGDFPPIDAATLQSQADAIIAQNEAQFAASRDTQGPGTESAGETVADAADARDEGATTQNPPVPPTQQDDAGAGADATAETVTTGTDGRLRTTQETQANPAPSALPGPVGYGTGSQPTGTTSGGATPTNTAGVGAPTDDAAAESSDLDTGSTGSNDVVTLVNKTARAITPRPNVLDQFASYTYSISIYLMSPEDYSRLLTSGKRFLAGYQLLMQSAGSPLQSGVVPPSAEAEDIIAQGGVSLSQGRNQFFPLDYYIDDVEIKSVVPGKGSGGAHNAVELKFRITEPNGITLLENLYKAVNQYITQGGGATKAVAPGNYAAQNYLMVIRFYGYDENGNAVIAPPASTAADRTDNRTIVEKFIPFQFTAIKFKIANKLTEYFCEAVCPQNVIATGQSRGVIPYNIEVTATTLQSLFNGNLVYSTPGATTAPNNATSAPDPVINSGLAQALNLFQAQQVTSGTYNQADRYKFVFSHPEIANASIVPPGSTNRNSVPLVDPASAAQAKDGDKQSMKNNAKTLSATAGMSIVQFIDMAVRSSDYIFKQQTKIKTVDRFGREVDVPQSTGGQAFAWYRIGVEAKPLGTTQDTKRNDQAYEITYEISPYAVNDIQSEYFPKGRFRGAQKKYSYWFTGENTSILDFEQDFNYLYYITVNTTQASTATSDYRQIEQYRELPKKVFSPNSAASNQGSTEPGVYEPGANAADYLYSPADQGRIKLSIVGDPAWLQQGEVWSGVRSTKKVVDESYDAYFDAFLKDGTINFDAREALFEITFNKPADYDLQSGVMKVSGPTVTSQTYVYKATLVTSIFRQGRFTQDLEGVLLIFPDPNTRTETVNTTTPVEDRSRFASDTGEVPGVTVQSGAMPQTSADIPTSAATPTTRLTRRGVRPSLTPVTPPALTDTQLQATPAYITARQAGKTPNEALAIARAASAAGTNNALNTALPGTTATANTGIVDDDGPFVYGP